MTTYKTNNTARTDDRRRGQKTLYAALLTLLLAACGGGGEDPEPTPGPVTTGLPPPTSSQSLTFHENAMVGLWSRFHRSDGSTQYMNFNSDRKGSKYTIENNGSRSDEKTITYWALESSGDNVFRIRLAGPGIASEPLGYLSPHEFHYALDQIWRGGYSTLRMNKR